MAELKKTITILGSTGSVGRSTVDLILSQPDKFSVEALTCNGNVNLLAEQAIKLKAKMAVVADIARYQDLKEKLTGTGIEVAAGPQALEEAATRDADLTMAAIVGVAGLLPIMAAIRQGRSVAIANKEPLVAAGPFVMEAARKSGAILLPVDSEHNAIFQVFDRENKTAIDKIILTASGGPFRDWTFEQMSQATPAQAVAHPNWSMGAKISVDSATMMNKALEVIEAHWLFDLPPEKIEVLVHPQSVIHSMVSYYDGSVLAQMGAPDMRTPIAYALAWPQRMKSTGEKLDFSKAMSLDFRPPDKERFPALDLAYQSLRSGLSSCVVLNAANEVAVEAFLAGRIGFLDIANITARALHDLPLKNLSCIDDVVAWDKEVRKHLNSTILSQGEFKRCSGTA